MLTYWQRQTATKPLYPDMLWSRPENRAYAGKLLIIGGNAHGFAAPAEAYIAAQKAGVGVARVLLPDSLHKTLGKTFDAGEFAPSTPSGSFAQKALAEWLSLAMWSDAVLVDGDMGRNSETAIVIEKFLDKFQQAVTVSSDTVDYLLVPALAEKVLMRPQTLIVATFSQLQKLFIAAHSPRALTSDMDLIRFVEALHHFSLQHHAAVIVKHHDRVYVAVEGQVSDTARTDLTTAWQTQVAAAAAVWWLQNPGKVFEALTTSLAKGV